MFVFYFASLLPALVAAQYGYGPAPTDATTASPSVPSAPPDSAGQINVDVAFQTTYTFHPANITAKKGTLVTFYFPNNGLTHSVTQSSFDAPCTYLKASNNTPAGFDSGLQAGVRFTINITDDTKPIWFHCKQVLHCGMGMVGSINAPAAGNNTFEAFQSRAIQIGMSEQTETDNGPVTGGVNGIATAPPSASTVPSGSRKLECSLSVAYLVMVAFGLIVA